ncbi:HAD hydrolase-like protein [Kutzneria chonburiensis]|uniref:HAD hydrolase-like protein n=1 Tax=Kutzneria chonburiensis TaxID=1483604 RepID=UPI00235EB100|nr:HAD hydrolase-like protein [Kutzneria chonburiensis]
MLWDIDHTLIETRGVGGDIFKRAFQEVTGKGLTRRADISGRTELDIMRESLAVNGMEPTNELVARLADALVDGYEARRDELGQVGRVLPGARETLAELADEETVLQTVLTGNLRSVARIKLEVFGLDGFLDLAAGAYGDDASDRAQLVSIAQERASDRFGSTFTNDQTLLVGDTPNDIRAGVAAGVRVLGVGTGKTPSADLLNAGASAVVDSLVGVSARVRRRPTGGTGWLA